MSCSYSSVKAREICEVTSSKRIYTSDYVKEGVPFYRGKEIIEKQKGLQKVSTELYISDSKYLEIKNKFGVPVEGDLLLTSVGTLGIPYIVKSGERFYFKDGNLIWFRKLRGILGEYLYYWLLSPLGKAELKKCTIGASQQAFTIVLIKNMELQLPPITMQNKVSAVLSSYDNLIENNLRRIKILEEMAEALYREWFVHFRFPGHEKVRFVDSPLGKIPEGWSVDVLGNVLELNYGKALKKQDRREGHVPVYGSSGVIGNHDVSLVSGPGIIIGRKGNVGSVFWSDADFFPIDTVYYVSSNMPLRYMFYDLQTKNFINNDAAVPGLNRQQAYSMETILPPPNLILIFCSLAEIFEGYASKLYKNNKVLHSTRDLLLPKLISGELDVSELDIDVSDVS